MNFMAFFKIAQGIWDMVNGHKFNAGAIVSLSILILQAMGMTGGEANSAATSVMLGISGVTAIVGAVHKVIKTEQDKKATKSK